MHLQSRSLSWRGCLALIAISAGAPAFGDDPSFVYHYAVTGASADLIDLGDTPIKQDVVVIYQHNLGRYPFINEETGEFVYGGLPHLANLNEHFAACLGDIVAAIPDPDWEGLAVIDYEKWSPWWDGTRQQYRDATIQNIRSERPELTDNEIEQLARETYEDAARRVYEGTIQLCKAMRPNAQWGYYAYPRKSQESIENTQWLWDACDVLFPAVYMRYYLVPNNVEPGLGQATYASYISSAFDGNLQYARSIAGDSKKVLAFAWPRYSASNPNQWYRLRFIEPEHLQLMIVGPYFWDADGVVLWDNLPQDGLADAFQGYFDNTIAPEIGRMNEYVIEQDRLHEESRVPEDTNDDGSVDTVDLSFVLQRLGTNNAIADINNDGIVDTLDISMVINAFTD